MEHYSALSLQNRRTRLSAALIKPVVTQVLRDSFKLNNLLIFDEFIDRHFHAPAKPSDLVLRFGFRSFIITAIGDVDAEGSFVQLSHNATGYRLSEARWRLLVPLLTDLIYRFYRNPTQTNRGFVMHQSPRPKTLFDLTELTFTRVDIADVRARLLTMNPSRERDATCLSFVGGNVHLYKENAPGEGIMYRRGTYNPIIQPTEDLPCV